MAELIRRLAKSSKVSRGKGRRLLIQELDRLEAALMKILNIAANSTIEGMLSHKILIISTLSIKQLKTSINLMIKLLITASI